ncbi:hypothetical protein [Kribbella shirazensis]|jgi:hypothetical protein|uniref:DUF3040 domain-containing protein n=1 Tax=Kribbella shirazensis TaxID=1105143 RepID=A0A7X6A5A0_9ACTN|nr:hypothetical protein [Kribbella shirazensis]NIK61865.1 hypothetical protein [Kribbella shirazensis]
MRFEQTEDQLRATLEALAAQTTSSPDAYAKTKREWQRRDRRRRLIMLGVASVVVAVADIVGLWALHTHDSPPPPPYTPATTAPPSPDLHGVVILP